jgi:hypothetical protein
MATQSYANHRRIVPVYLIMIAVLLLTFVGACVNLYESWGDHVVFYSASLIVVTLACVIMCGVFARTFALRAQDRAIRSEENLRHYVLSGKLLDARLEIKQIVALRFASDGEFAELARKAAQDQMTPGAIKKSVKNWRPDTYRV